MNLSTSSVIEALEHYGVRAGRSTHETAGEAITVAGKTNGSEKSIVVSSGANGVERLAPLEVTGAAYLAANFRGHHHHGTSEHGTRMLEHLLIRISDFFIGSGVDAFEIGVRLHENSYSVASATARASRAVLVDKRLTPHAHDRKDEGLLSESVTEPRRRSG